MPLSRKKKEKLVEKLTERFQKNKTAVFADYQGLTVNETQELRKQLREQEIDYNVIKNTLAKIAAKNAGVDMDLEFFAGKPLAIAFSYKDEIAPAKIIYNFAKEHEALEITGGIFQNEFIDKARVEELAQVPERVELEAKLVGVLAAPMSGLLNALQGNLRSLVYILSQYKEQVIIE